MSAYFMAVFIVILVLSLFLTYVLKRNNLLNLYLLTGIVVGSTVSSLMYPFILNIFLKVTYIGFFTALFMSFITFVVILSIFSIIITQLMYRGNFDIITKFITHNMLVSRFAKKYMSTNTGSYIDSEINSTFFNEAEQCSISEKPVDTEQKIDTIVIEEKIMINIEKNVVLHSFFEDVAEEILENDIIQLDKEFVTSSSNFLTSYTNIDDIIIDIFCKKQSGDLEGALALSIKIMETKPEDSLVFWIVPEICLLLKQLGQKDFARFVLEGYTQRYGVQIKANEIINFI